MELFQKNATHFLFSGINNFFPKGCQRKLCQFKMLSPKRNTNDGKAKQQPKNQVDKSAV
jgi:hypothetical protein